MKTLTLKKSGQEDIFASYPIPEKKQTAISVYGAVHLNEADSGVETLALRTKIDIKKIQASFSLKIHRSDLIRSMSVIGLHHPERSFTIPLTNSKKAEAEFKSCYPLPSSLEPASSLTRIKLLDILPEYGTPSDAYMKAVEELSGCLSRHGAAIIELNSEDSALIRCGLESAKIYFRNQNMNVDANRDQSLVSESRVSSLNPDLDNKFLATYIEENGRESYQYRAGRRCVSKLYIIGVNAVLFLRFDISITTITGKRVESFM